MDVLHYYCLESGEISFCRGRFVPLFDLAHDANDLACICGELLFDLLMRQSCLELRSVNDDRSATLERQQLVASLLQRDLLPLEIRNIETTSHGSNNKENREKG